MLLIIQLAQMKRLDKVLDEIQIKTKDDFEYISTGFASLDELFGGGWQIGGLTVISSYSGIDCTDLALNTALKTSNNDKVLFLTRPHSISEIAKRIISIKLSVDFHMVSEQDKNILKSEIENLNLYLEYYSNNNIDDLLNIIEKQRKQGVKLIFIDKFNYQGDQIEDLSALQSYSEKNNIAIVYLMWKSCPIRGFVDSEDYEYELRSFRGNWIPSNCVYLYRPTYFGFNEMKDENDELMDAYNVLKVIYGKRNFAFGYENTLLKYRGRYHQIEECDFKENKYPNWFPKSHNGILYNKDQKP